MNTRRISALCTSSLAFISLVTIFQNCGPGKLTGVTPESSVYFASTAAVSVNVTPTPAPPVPMLVDVTGQLKTYSGDCMDMAVAYDNDGVSTILNPCSDSKSQVFRLRSLASSGPSTGVVSIMIINTGKCLQVEADTGLVKQYSCSYGDGSQSFHYTPNKDGSFTLKDYNTGRCLTAPDIDPNAVPLFSITTCRSANVNQNFHN
jgi:hypothetical protein